MKTTSRTLALLSAFAVLSATADTIYLQKGDGSDKNSFENGTNFDGKKPCAGNDYVVNLGLSSANGLRTRDASSDQTKINIVFGGDSLQLGGEGKESYLILKTVGTMTNVVNDLRLVKGNMSPASGGSTSATVVESTDLGLTSISVIGGHATVLSSVDAPYRFTGSYRRGINLTADLAGGPETGLIVGRHCGTAQATERTTGHFALYLSADNTKYQGKWTVDGYSLPGAISNQQAPSDPRWKVLLQPVDRAALGDDPASFVADSVTLLHGAVFSLPASAEGHDFDFGNRGVTLGVGGGMVKHTGTGRLTLKGTFSGAGNLVVSTVGDFAFAGTWSSTGKLVVTDQALFLRPEAQIAASDIELNGSAYIVYESADGVNTLDVWPVAEGERFSVLATAFEKHGEGERRVAVVKVPAAVKSGLTADDFAVVYRGDLGEDATLAQVKVEIETDGETGLQTVYLTRPTYITMTNTGTKDEAPQVYYNTTTEWSDGENAHAQADYLIFAAHPVRTPNTENETFPGDSLTLVGSSACRAELAVKTKNFTIDRLFAGGYSTLSFKAFTGLQTQTLTGHLHVTGKGDTGGFWLRSASQAGASSLYPNANVRETVIAAEISGDGDITIWPYENHNSYLRITSLNENFTGAVRLKEYLYSTTRYQPTLMLEDSRNIGVNPPAYLEKGLSLTYGHLYVDRDVTIDHPNRELYLQSEAYLEVTNGATLAVTCPVLYNGVWVRKDGDGLLNLSGRTVGGADNVRFFVRNGALLQSDLSAFKDLKTLCVYPSAKLIVPYQTADENGLLFKGGKPLETPLVIGGGGTKLNVDIALPSEEKLPRTFTLPLFTVRKGLADTTVTDTDPVGVTSADQIVLPARLASGHRAKLSAADVTIDGVEYVRYSADCRIPGLAIIVR